MSSRSASRQRALAPAPWLADANRTIVAVVLVAVTLVFWTGANDVYVTPKVTMLLLGGLALLAAHLWSAGSGGAVRLPRSRPVVLGGVFLAVMVVATVLGGHRMTSLFGEYGRGGGLLTYAVAFLLFVVVLTEHDELSVRHLLHWATAVGGVVMVYGLVQVVGFEPFSVASGGIVLSTLGQANLMAGFAGVVLPLFLWVAADRELHGGWRVGAAAMVVATLVVGAETASFQAVLAIGAGVAVFAVAVALERWPVRKVMLGAAAVVLVLALVAGGAHSTVESQVRNGLEERVLMWQAGAKMVSERPLVGFGPSGYAANFTTYRPRAHAERFGALQIVDVPHDVPLAMFVSGGIALGLAYLVFVGAIGWALVQGLRRMSGSRRIALGAAGGAWVAYQAQSLVSIDGPALIVYEFVLAAAVLLLAGPMTVRSLSLPGLVRPDRRGGTNPSGAGWWLGAAAVLIVVLGGWFAVRPLVADAAFARAKDHRASNDLDRALSDLESATSNASWVGPYWAELAAVLVQTGDQEGALAAGMTAAELSPSSVSYALSTAHLADLMGRSAVADRYFDFGLRHAPYVAAVLRANVEYLVGNARFDEALLLTRGAVRRAPTDVPSLTLLATVAEGAGQPAEARSAWERILRLEPTNQDALQALGRTP